MNERETYASIVKNNGGKLPVIFGYVSKEGKVHTAKGNTTQAHSDRSLKWSDGGQYTIDVVDTTFRYLPDFQMLFWWMDVDDAIHYTVNEHLQEMFPGHIIRNRKLGRIFGFDLKDDERLDGLISHGYSGIDKSPLPSFKQFYKYKYKHEGD